MSAAATALTGSGSENDMLGAAEEAGAAVTSGSTSSQFLKCQVESRGNKNVVYL